MADKFIISGGYMCDMSCKAFIYQVDGRWIFDAVEFRKWYRPLANAGLRQHRNNPYCVGSDEPRSAILMPWKYVKTIDGWQFYHYEVIGKDKDGKDIKAMVPDFNPDYFTILRQLAEELKALNVQLVFCLSDQCQANREARREQSPFYGHNANGIQTIYDRAAVPVWAAFARKALQTLDGLDGAVEIGNEINHPGFLPAAEAICKEVYTAGVKPWNISLGAYMLSVKYLGDGKYDDREHENTNAEKICRFLVQLYDREFPDLTHQVYWPVHGVGDRQEIPGRPYGERWHQWSDWRNSPGKAASTRDDLSTDGTDHGDGPTGRPSRATWKAMIKSAISQCPNKSLKVGGYQKFKFDYLPNRQNTAEIADMIEAMSEAHFELFGVWPENHGKFPPIIEPEPNPAPEDPPPAPLGKPAPWWSWARICNVRRWTWQAWLAVLAIVILALAIL